MPTINQVIPIYILKPQQNSLINTERGMNGVTFYKYEQIRDAANETKEKTV